MDPSRRGNPAVRPALSGDLGRGRPACSSRLLRVHGHDVSPCDLHDSVPAGPCANEPLCDPAAKPVLVSINAHSGVGDRDPSVLSGPPLRPRGEGVVVFRADPLAAPRTRAQPWRLARASSPDAAMRFHALREVFAAGRCRRQQMSHLLSSVLALC